jgi:hypothetical protein
LTVEGTGKRKCDNFLLTSAAFSDMTCYGGRDVVEMGVAVRHDTLPKKKAAPTCFLPVLPRDPPRGREWIRRSRIRRPPGTRLPRVVAPVSIIRQTWRVLIVT